MNTLNSNSLSKRILALIGATGTTALLGLPVLAQVNPNPSITNEAPYSQSQSGQTPVQCPPSVGGVGGPIEGSAQSNNASGQSSYDTASQGVNPNSSSNSGSMNSNSMGSMNSESMNQANNSATGSDRSAQFSGDNPRPGVAYRDNGPAGTSGREATSNLEANDSRTSGATSANVSGNQLSNNTSGNYTGSSQQYGGMVTDGQFSGRNRSAAIAYRSNGPAGTSGLEARMNLEAFNSDDSRRASNQSAANQSTIQSSGSMMNSSSQGYQSAAPIPAECIPGASGSYNQSAPAQ